jgi:hypothetical protein
VQGNTGLGCRVLGASGYHAWPARRTHSGHGESLAPPPPRPRPAPPRPATRVVRDLVAGPVPHWSGRCSSATSERSAVATRPRHKAEAAAEAAAVPVAAPGGGAMPWRTVAGCSVLQRSRWGAAAPTPSARPHVRCAVRCDSDRRRALQGALQPRVRVLQGRAACARRRRLHRRAAHRPEQRQRAPQPRCAQCAFRCASASHTAQAGTAQVGTAKMGTAQVGTAQVGTAQVGTAQVGTAQAGTAHRWRRCASASRGRLGARAARRRCGGHRRLHESHRTHERQRVGVRAESRLRRIPLTANPAYGESRLRRIPLTANPAYGESRLRRIPLTANPAHTRAHLPGARLCILRYNSRALVHDKVGRHSAAIADFDEASAAENRRGPSPRHMLRVASARVASRASCSGARRCE